MQRFSDIPYSRVTLEQLRPRYEALMQQLRSAATYEDYLALEQADQRLSADMTPMTVCSIRHDMDLNEPFYAQEQAYYDSIAAELRELGSDYDRALLASPLRDFLRERVGEQAFAIMTIAQQDHDARLAPLQQEERALCERYSLLTANATVTWQGREVPRAQLVGPLYSPDRETRRAANRASGESWMRLSPQLEDIYDRLVQLRAEQAKLLGYESFSRLSYRRMYRIGYGAEDVAAFIAQAKRYLVPVWQRQRERRRERLGLERLYLYDTISFPQGDPTPLGGTDWCLARTREMYEALSPETAAFARDLFDGELFDVEQRTGKRGGGYQATLADRRLPFIFANFDGTSENAYIMCHEGGHAFQSWLKRTEPVRERCWNTSEVAETHAMAMELFTLPHMELFFGERADDYRSSLLEGAVTRILFQCQQDEFQQAVYTHPQMTKDERNALWQRLENEYFPGRLESSGENHFVASGRSWQTIPHAFHWPFYAIDYGLSQVCALGFYEKFSRDAKGAWESYLRFCRDSGTKSFPQLVRDSGIGDPFSPGTLAGLPALFT